MKTLLILLVLGAAAYVGYRFFLTPEKRACGRMAELCGAQAEVERHRCEQAFADLEKLAGGEAARGAATCITDAQSCPQALGCMAGLAGKAGAGAANEFLKGLGKALGQ